MVQSQYYEAPRNAETTKQVQEAAKIIQKFEELEKKNEGAFVPFMNIGDPSVEASERVLSGAFEI